MTMTMMGMLEAMSGIGQILGSTGGSYMYARLGFKMTYVSFGGLLPVLAIIARIVLELIERKKITNGIREPLLA